MRGIYAIVNIAVTPIKVLFGQTNSIERRFREHRSLLKKNNHDNPKLQNAFNKYGEDAFWFSTYEEIPKESLTFYEAKAIKDAKARGLEVYNISNPENPREWSEEARLNHSLIMKGKKTSLGVKRTPKQLIGYSERAKGKHYNLGIPKTEEHKRKISEAMKKACAKRKM